MRNKLNSLNGGGEAEHVEEENSENLRSQKKWNKIGEGQTYLQSSF